MIRVGRILSANVFETLLSLQFEAGTVRPMEANDTGYLPLVPFMAFDESNQLS